MALSDWNAVQVGERWAAAEFDAASDDAARKDLADVFAGIGHPISGGARHALVESLRAGLDNGVDYDSDEFDAFVDIALAAADAKWTALRAAGLDRAENADEDA